MRVLRDVKNTAGAVRALLRFRGPSAGEAIVIGTKTEQALRTLGSESLLNRIRAERFGVGVDQPDEEGDLSNDG